MNIQTNTLLYWLLVFFLRRGSLVFWRPLWSSYRGHHYCWGGHSTSTLDFSWTFTNSQWFDVIITRGFISSGRFLRIVYIVFMFFIYFFLFFTANCHNMLVYKIPSSRSQLFTPKSRFLYNQQDLVQVSKS